MWRQRTIDGTTRVRVAVRGVVNGAAAQLARLLDRKIVAVSLYAYRKASQVSPKDEQHHHKERAAAAAAAVPYGIENTVGVGRARADREAVVLETLAVAIDVVEVGARVIPTSNHCALRTHQGMRACTIIARYTARRGAARRRRRSEMASSSRTIDRP